MQYKLSLKRRPPIIIGTRGRGHWGETFELIVADIMYWTDKDDAIDGNKKDKGTNIGTLTWQMYYQTLAIKKGINMTNVSELFVREDYHLLLELDYTHLTQETIDEIGAASNPNIVILYDLDILAAWRNKGIGVEVMKAFIRQLKGNCGYIIISRNVPAQFNKFNAPGSEYAKPAAELDNLEKDPEKAQYQLNAFWQRCGFKQFKNYDNVFICNVDQAVRDHSQATRSASQLL